MKISPIIKHIFIFSILLSCAARKGIDNSGILTGVTGVFHGNCMPSPGQPPCQATPISTTVYVTAQAEKFSLELLKDSVVSSENGAFKILLPSGRYSLFLRNGDEIVCRGIQCSGPCVCMPFKIVTDSTTVLNPNLDRAAW